MAKGNDSEEKNLPPSDKKLREARKKGQLAKSQDMATAMVMVGCTLCIAILVPDIIQQMRGFLDLTARVYDQPFNTLWPRMLSTGVHILAHALLPLIAVTLAAVVLTNIVVMKGLVFSGDPVKPKPEHINPVEGAKRIFSVRRVIEFFKSLVKMIALGVALVIVYRINLPALMQSSLCGLRCTQGTFIALIKPLVITTLLAFLIVGFLDVFMQRWLFKRDQRMSKTERKRERKDMDGDPLIRQARRRLRRQAHAGGKVGVRNASVMIGEQGNWVVGIRYSAEEAGVPFLVCRASPEQADTLIVQASRYRLPIAYDSDLAQRIADHAAIGEPVPQSTFQEVADILVSAGLL